MKYGGIYTNFETVPDCMMYDIYQLKTLDMLVYMELILLTQKP